MAFDLKAEAVQVGKEIGEDAARKVVTRILRPLIEEKVKESDNKMDDLLLPFLDQLEEALLEGPIDDIDGKDD